MRIKALFVAFVFLVGLVCQNAWASFYQTSSEYISSDSDSYAPYSDYSRASRVASRTRSTSTVTVTTYRHSYYNSEHHVRRHNFQSYSSRLPSVLTNAGEKTIVVDPRVHAWGAYSADGKLIRAGLATAGSNWCPDLHRPCRTKSGVFRISSLGDSSCISKKFPLGEGGAPMPYCMYFNGGQGLHGSYEVAEANLSHGCVRVSVSDAHWLRFNFSTIGTKVVIKPY